MPPDLLVMAWQSEMWKALPEAGGLRDQPANLLTQMSACLNVYNAFKSMQGKQIAQWADTNPEQFKMVIAIEKMEKENG